MICKSDLSPRLSIFLLLILLAIDCQSQDWQYRQVAGKDSTWRAATVPGTVHQDLYNSGLIPHPYYRDNEDSVQWVEGKDWEYKTTLVPEAKLLREQHIELVCEGLDTYAQVFLNGELIGSTQNMFVEHRMDLKGKLKPGPNALLIRFQSAYNRNLVLFRKAPYKLPAINDKRMLPHSQEADTSVKQTSIYARKAPYHFGWDWGPRLVTAGIWRPIYLHGWSGARVVTAGLHQGQSKKSGKQTATMYADLVVDTTALDSLQLDWGLETGRAALRKPTGIAKAQRLKPNMRVEQAVAGLKNWEAETARPKQLPDTYTLRPSIKDKTKRLEGTRQYLSGLGTGSNGAIGAYRTGLALPSLARAKDKNGKAFTVGLNGRPIFCRGANYIPQDIAFGKDRGKTRSLLLKAKEANMNMIRVWGGGYYEDDYFYDVCDSLGLMVWQDLMFACSMYPGDTAFLANVKEELRQTVQRLKRHPSIVLWCGNNEISQGWQDGWIAHPQSKRKGLRADSLRVDADMKKLFFILIPTWLKEWDPQRPYTPSSPWPGTDSMRVNAKGYGDKHDWAVWFSPVKFDAYESNTSRFVSEYGFQSFPDLRTIESCTLPMDRSPESPVMQTHQKHYGGNSKILRYAKDYLRLPDGSDFAGFVYTGQVAQALAIGTAVEAHRRAKPYCMGSLYWQLNDCWPVASWSGIDYYQRPKALHYAMARAYDPFAIACKALGGDSLAVHTLWDRPMKDKATVKAVLCNLQGKVLKTVQQSVKLPAAENGVVFLRGLDPAKNGLDSANAVVIVTSTLTCGCEEREQLFFYKPYKDLALPKPTITLKAERNKRGQWVLRVATTKIALRIWLQPRDSDIDLDDNGFDLLPGATKELLVKNYGGTEAPTFDIRHL